MKILLWAVSCLWAAVLVAQIGTWSTAHAVPLQSRDIAITLPAAPQWRAVHVLVDGCECSRAVAEYLRHRGPQPGWQEEIWILGAASSDPIAGFAITTPSAEAIQAAGLVGGPRLLLFSPTGRLEWTGGYGPRKPREAESMLDLPVMLAASRGETPVTVPVYGCPRRNTLPK